MTSHGHWYLDAHAAARVHLRGRTCLRCGGLPIQAALGPGTPPGRIVVDEASGQRYSLTPSDYLPLCPPCHRAMDHPSGVCRKGHRIEGANAYRRRGRTPECATCHRARWRRYAAARRAAPPNGG